MAGDEKMAKDAAQGGKAKGEGTKPPEDGAPQNAGAGNDDYKESMMRLAAEFDNYKKRVRADMENSKGLGKAELLKEMLPILDEFELSLIALEKSADRTMAKGVELLYSNISDTLKKSGLKEVPASGVFDPYKHEIIMVREDGNSKPGTILAVTKKGYTFNDMLLRPASVIVSKEAERQEGDKGAPSGKAAGQGPAQTA